MLVLNEMEGRKRESILEEYDLAVQLISNQMLRLIVNSFVMRRCGVEMIEWEVFTFILPNYYR